MTCRGEHLATPGTYRVNNVNDLADIVGKKAPKPGPVYDKSVPKLLDQCLQKASTPDNGHSLHKYIIVDSKSLHKSQKPPPTCHWELGHYFQKFKKYILWYGLTVEGGEHCYNHTARIYPDGKIEGTVNCFGLGEMPLEADFAKGHLEEWLGRIQGAPYWDEIDHKPTSV